MAKISTEFRKGVFFVRLVGRNGNESEIKSIIELIEEFGINNIVINLTKLNSLSLEMIQRLNEFLKEKSKEKNLFLIYNQNKSRIFEGKFPMIEKQIDVYSILKEKLNHS